MTFTSGKLLDTIMKQPIWLTGARSTSRDFGHQSESETWVRGIRNLWRIVQEHLVKVYKPVHEIVVVDASPIKLKMPKWRVNSCLWPIMGAL